MLSRFRLWLVAILLVGTATRASAAQRGYVLDVAGPLPFALAELADAVGARVTLAEDPEAAEGVLYVRSAGKALVSVTLGARSRVIALGKKSGASAARVVALIVSDLVLESALPEPLPEATNDDEGPLPTSGGGQGGDPGDDGSVPDDPDDGSVSDELGDGVVDVATSAGVRARPKPASSATRPAARAPALVLGDGASLGVSKRVRPRRPLDHTLLVMPGIGKGTGYDEPLTRSIEGAFSFPSSVGRMYASVTLVHTPSERVSTGWAISMTALTTRLHTGFRAGLIEGYAGPFWSAYELDGEGVGSLFGVGGKLLVAPALSRHLHLVLALGADAYLSRVRVQLGGEDAFSTPRLGLTVSAGLGWGL